MKYSFLFLITLATVVFSCKTVKKTQVIQEAITKKDTTPTIVIKESPKVDSAAIVKDIMSKVMKGKIDFNTFNAKIKVKYVRCVFLVYQIIGSCSKMVMSIIG